MAAFYDPVAAMEPMMPAEGRTDLEDLAVTLIEKAGALAGQLNPVVARSAGALVRSMNCYYSNLIEDHNTHPADIERAMRADYSNDPEKRNLQMEARAHIELQQMVDGGGLKGPVCAPDFIRRLHKEFCGRLPDKLLEIKNPDTGERIRMTPGAFRSGAVQVGRHIPPEAGALERLTARFEDVYAPEKHSRTRQMAAAAASHHRLLWIHPFYDGNGRVARMFAHAYFRETGVKNELWSVSRGLARRTDDYKRFLAAADSPRRGDTDGRGNLSAAALDDFCVFFLETCIGQIEFMESLLQPAGLAGRIERWAASAAAEKTLPKGCYPLLREALFAGEFERGRAADITGYKERQGRTVLNALLGRGLLVSDTPRSPVRLSFPAEAAAAWFPGLYPDTPG